MLFSHQPDYHSGREVDCDADRQGASSRGWLVPWSLVGRLCLYPPARLLKRKCSIDRYSKNNTRFYAVGCWYENHDDAESPVEKP